jgi:hypothetical protein
MNPKPIKYTAWIESRREFMVRIGWTDAELLNDEFISEYRVMLIALKKACTIQGIAYTLGSTAPTIRRDRILLGICATKRGGNNRNVRLYSHDNKLMTCQQVADFEGCGYNTAYARLNRGGWIA